MMLFFELQNLQHFVEAFVFKIFEQKNKPLIFKFKKKLDIDIDI